ncbi:hypothetical protein Glove_9g16 [Diversispora epigaea]|uniref:Uncharacterized protein n=1 Tax=Diversispora epigaea TaxID=1348612 RepID=A0A397JPR1_9GLOM|nr:hypothetical protein Glove_9g16 [Diversispora epigaea]
MSRMRNRSIFASAIARLPAFTTPSTSITSRRTRPGTEPTAPFVVEEEEEREATRKEINVSESSMKRLIAKIDSLDKKMDTLLKEQIDIKKRLKNIELLSEINNDPNFSKDVITRVTTNVFKVNIFPSEKNLKEETKSVIRKSFPDIYESMNSQHHSSFFKKIKTKLLEKLRGMRGGITSRVKSAIFEIFGESQLPHIDFQSSLTEINSWKSDQRVKDAYRKLFEGVAIAQLFLNPKRKLQNKLPLKPGDGELKAEQTTKEESEEWEEEERSPKRRRTSEDRVLSPRLGSPRLDSPRLGSPRLASSRLVSPRLVSSRPVSSRPVSPRFFESPDTPDTSDTTREEGDTTGGDTKGAEIRKLQNKLPLKPGDGELKAEQTTKEESEEWEEEERSPKRRRTSEDRVLSPRLGSPRLDSPRLGSPRLASSRLVSPRLVSSRPVSSRPVSPRFFESPDTPDTSDTTREEGDTTGGDTKGAEIVGQ